MAYAESISTYPKEAYPTPAPPRQSVVHSVSNAASEVAELADRIRGLAEILCGSGPEEKSGGFGSFAASGVFPEMESSASRIISSVQASHQALNRIRDALP